MNRHAQTDDAPRRYSPLYQLILARIREFTREPEAVFWVYGFPILMVIALGIAFRNKGVEVVTVDVVAGEGAKQVVESLAKLPSFMIQEFEEVDSRQRLRTGMTDVVLLIRSANS